MDSRALVFRYAGVTQNALSAGSPTTCIRYCKPRGEYLCHITFLILWQPSESDDWSHTITFNGFTWLPSRYRIGGCLCLWGRVFESHVLFCDQTDSVWQLWSFWAIWRDETTLKKSDGVGSLTKAFFTRLMWTVLSNILLVTGSFKRNVCALEILCSTNGPEY